MVGMAGLEPATSPPRTERSAQAELHPDGASGPTRTVRARGYGPRRLPGSLAWLRGPCCTGIDQGMSLARELCLPSPRCPQPDSNRRPLAPEASALIPTELRGRCGRCRRFSYPRCRPSAVYNTTSKTQPLLVVSATQGAGTAVMAKGGPGASRTRLRGFADRGLPGRTGPRDRPRSPRRVCSW